MSVTVEDVSDVEKRLTFVLPSEEFANLYESQINSFMKTADIKGFRPGKVPRSMIVDRFGKEAQDLAVDRLIKKNLNQELENRHLKPVIAPSVEIKPFKIDEPFQFVATVELLPSIKDIAFNLDQIEKLTVEVTEDDLDFVIEQLRKQYTTWKKVDRGAQLGDRVVIDYHSIFEGKADLDNKVENYTLELGSGVMIPGFEEGLVGAKENEERTLALVFPADFPMQDKAGKPVEFIVTIKTIYEGSKPIANAEFAQKLGVVTGDLTELRKEIRRTLEIERDHLIMQKMKEQIFPAIVEQNPLNIPSGLVAIEAKTIHDEIFPHHKKEGEHHHSEEETEHFKKIAKDRITLSLLLEEYARQHQLKVDPQKVIERIKMIAQSYEDQPEVVKYLLQDEQRASIEFQLMEDVVVEKLIENTKKTEKVISYKELKNIRE